MASISKRGEYQFQVIVRRKGYPSKTATFETRKEAQIWARRIESEMDQGKYMASRAEATTTLKEAFLRYDKEITANKRSSPAEHTRLQRLCNALPCAAKPITAVRGADLSAYIAKRRLDGVKDQTILLDIALISHVFTVARLDWGMESLTNPCTLIRKPKGSVSRTRRLSGEEERRLIEAATVAARNLDGTYGGGGRAWYTKAVILFALETAMRRGEIAGLQWEDVYLERRFVRLHMTKNGESRDVPLTPAAIALLTGLDQKATGSVFGCSPNAITCAWTETLKRARTTYASETVPNRDLRMLADLRFHDLRHEATTRLASKLTNVLELSAVTGHKSLQMVKRYYNPTPEELAEKLARVV